MGFFSWHTQDTDRSIPSSYSIRTPFTVFMYDNNGNKWREDEYEGYGVFGGKDYYELLAEMNGYQTRYEGIDVEFIYGKPFITPNLVEDENWTWINEAPKDCPLQGFFYGDSNEDDEIDDPITDDYQNEED